MKEEISCGTVSCQTKLDEHYWNQKWEDQEMGWDIGQCSPPIQEYLMQYHNKDAKILIPGCGNAYEAEFLLNNGFHNITIIDIAPSAARILEEKFSHKPEVKVICGDFFEHEGKYDLIIEQTFFCAIPTLLRKDYAKKMHELLNENGKVIGVMFNINFEQKGPPYGGSIPEYQFIFKKYFDIKIMEECFNSIEARRRTEIFIILKKKINYEN